MMTRRSFAGFLAAATTTAVGSVRECRSFFKKGAKMVCLSNRGRSQMLGIVFVSPSGNVVVVDGGTPDEAPALQDVIKSFGGEVSCWLITHPHYDHFGALMKLLKRPLAERPCIRSLRFSFPPCDWIRKYEPRRVGFVGEFLKVVSSSGVDVQSLNCGDAYDFGGGTRFSVLNTFDLSIVKNAVNNASICFSIEHGGRRILLPGDLGVEGGERLLKLIPEKLAHDVVVMAHHGQRGVNKAFYSAVKPAVAIWPTPKWLWDNDASIGRKDRIGGIGSGTFLTNYVKCWLQELGVREQYVLTEDLFLS